MINHLLGVVSFDLLKGKAFLDHINPFYPALVIWAVKFHWLEKFLLYIVTDQNIAFLAPNSCWATERNGNSISANVTGDAFENV